MITDNAYAADQLARYIDTKVVKMKDALAKQAPKDQYMDLVNMWSTLGAIKALENLKTELVAKE